MQTLGLDRLSEKTAVATPSFDHPPWLQLPHARGPIRGAPLDVNECVFHAELWVLSLSMEEGRSTFGVMAGIWAKF